MDGNRKFWDRNARLYTPIQEKSNRELFGIVIPQCGNYITGDTMVLELACGTGQFTLPLARRAGSWEATDFSPKMIEQAKQRNIPGASFSVQDATDLPYTDGSFDLVLIANALHIMPEPRNAMAEIRRVLKPEGILLAPTFVYEGNYSRLKLRIMELAGFKSYFKWTTADLARFVTDQGFSIREQHLIPSTPVPEGFIAAKKL